MLNYRKSRNSLISCILRLGGRGTVVKRKKRRKGKEKAGGGVERRAGLEEERKKKKKEQKRSAPSQVGGWWFLIPVSPDGDDRRYALEMADATAPTWRRAAARAAAIALFRTILHHLRAYACVGPVLQLLCSRTNIRVFAQREFPPCAMRRALPAPSACLAPLLSPPPPPPPPLLLLSRTPTSLLIAISVRKEHAAVK